MDTKKLRQKILDLAIRGKLVPQDPNDEPASVLLECIRAEKEQLIKEGKIKRSKKSAATDKSHYENVPFEIPENWCWTTLGDVGKWQSGATPSRLCKEYYGGDIPWLKTGDLNDGYITDIPEYITQKALKETSVKLNPAGSILIAMYGATIGKVGILTFPATTNQACCACVEYEATDQQYLFYFLLSHKENFIRQGGGGAQPNISKEKIVETLLPLPPFNEQKRIVNEVEKWFSIIDKIESSTIELESYVKHTKSKILDLAISGKLVPQDPNDEPAIKLLKRINPGFEPCDNSHYENLPQGWVKLRLGDVCSFERGITFPSSAKCTIKQPGMIACIRTANVQDNLELDDLWYVGNEYIKGNTEKLVRKNDIIMSSANSRELVGKVSYVHDLTEQMTFGGFVLNIRANECILPFFLFLMLRTLYLKGYYLTIATQTTNIANLNTKILGDIEVLLPPLTEQERIINSVTNILASIENITAEL